MKRRYKIKRRGRMFRAQQYGGALPAAFAAKAALVGLKIAKVAAHIARIGAKVAPHMAKVAHKWPQALRASTHIARATKHLQPIVKPIQKTLLPVTRAYGRAKAATYGRIITNPFEKAMAQAALGGGPMKFSLPAHGVDKGLRIKGIVDKSNYVRAVRAARPVII